MGVKETGRNRKEEGRKEGRRERGREGGRKGERERERKITLYFVLLGSLVCSFMVSVGLDQMLI